MISPHRLLFRTCLSHQYRSFCLTSPYLNVKDNIGFIGTGKIAQALITGLVKRELFKPEQIYANDADLNYLKFLKEKSPLFQVKFKLNYVFGVVAAMLSPLNYQKKSNTK